ncbi:MAG: Acyl-CoA thioesterase YbgC [Elusimicrobia bacterium]|nr:Acyl-CoA thioesterase YbgC [Elusimicrobiota bacterium]
MHQFEFRISYADTDRMGVVYYANYLTLFERGRTELLREIGLRYRDLEEVEKVFLPVSEASCRYLHPAKYDDLIRVTTRIGELGGASIKFSYEIFDAETGRKIAEGFTRHPFVNSQWKPVRVPQKLREKLTPLTGR